MNSDGNKKFEFREFAFSITPIYPQLEGEPFEFRLNTKSQIKADNYLLKKTQIRESLPLEKSARVKEKAFQGAIF